MKLGAWLELYDVTQQAFARLIGSGQSQVARFAAGERIPRREVMRKIARATGGKVTADDFYDIKRGAGNRISMD